LPLLALWFLEAEQTGRLITGSDALENKPAWVEHETQPQISPKMLYHLHTSDSQLVMWHGLLFGSVRQNKAKIRDGKKHWHLTGLDWYVV